MQLMDLKHYMNHNKIEQKIEVIQDLISGWKTVNSPQRLLLVKIIDDIFSNKTETTVEKIKNLPKIKNQPAPEEYLLKKASRPALTPSVYTQTEKSIARVSKPDTVKSEEIPENEKKPSM